MAKIRHANANDISKLSEVHLVAFKSFFLSSLGFNFLNFLYKQFLHESEGVLLVLEIDEQIIGFAVGCTDSVSFYKKIKTPYNFMKGAYLCLPYLLKNPIHLVKRVFRAIFSKKSPSKIKGGALLSSIAVLPSYAGNNYGGLLLESFEKIMLTHGVEVINLTTDKLNNDNVLNFYRKNGYELDSILHSESDRPMVQLRKNLIK